MSNGASRPQSGITTGLNNRNDIRKIAADYLFVDPGTDETTASPLIAAEADAAHLAESAAPGVGLTDQGACYLQRRSIRQRLLNICRVSVERTVEAAAELVNRLGDWFERTAERGMGTLSRLLTEEERPSSGRDRDMER